MVRIRVLGPLAVEVGGRAVTLGGPRQRAVLARLVVARGELVSVDRLIEDLWRGEPPAKAVTSLQSYVSNLRRLLEPQRPPRTPATVLLSASPGYALALGPEAVDAWRFESLLREARRHSSAGTARALISEGLSLWRGEAFGEVADESWATADIARLAELRAEARQMLAAAELRAGNLAAAVRLADALTRREPLREEGWRLLALSLWGGNRQADALDALRRARRQLTEELGLDPGPELARLEEAILRQNRELLDAAMPPSAPTSAPPSAPPSEPPGSSQPDGSSPPLPAAASAAELFAGREQELAALADVAAEVTAAEVRAAGVGAGRARIALISGEPGAGKSALLRQVRHRLATTGWLVVTGQCPEAEGAPPAWAWLQALRVLADAAPPPAPLAELLAPLLSDQRPDHPPGPTPGHDLGSDLGRAVGHRPGQKSTDTDRLDRVDASAGRFRLHQAVLAWLRTVADRTPAEPLAIILDDLHWADAETLALLGAVAAQVTDAPILLLVAYRDGEVGPALTEALAGLAARSPRRLALGGLSRAAIADVVGAVCRRPVDADTVLALAERTGGNPFHVRESARLLASEGALVALSEVPDGVRDVLRRRLARLPAASVAVLRLAAVAGREADVEVLIDAANTDEDGVLDALDAGLIAGLLTEPAPGRVRFTHALVRDTLSTDLSLLRRTRMHARLGATLERLQPDNTPALAHHYLRAASAATARRAVDYAVRAAQAAERRYAHDTAADLLAGAVDGFDRLPVGDHACGETDRDAERVLLLGRLLRAQVRAGAVAAARACRQRAVDHAEAAGREDLLIAAFTAWTDPTPWQSRPYGTVDAPVVAVLTRLLERPGLDATVRCRLLDALTTELAGEDDARPRRAAEEAVALSATQDDPALRALALTALARVRNHEPDWPERDRVGQELIEIGVAYDLPAYRSFGNFARAIAAVADSDVTGVRRFVADGMHLARLYRMPEAEGVGAYGQAMLAHIAGDLDDAERRYTETSARMLRHGSIHAAGFQLLAVATLRLTQGRMAEFAAHADDLLAAHGPVMIDLLTLALARDGRLAEATRLHAAAPPLRPDFLFSTLAVLRAEAAIAVADRPLARAMYGALLPLRGQVPGALSLSLALRPVAHTLGALAAFLGRYPDAADHFRQARTVAERWGATHWADEARRALAAITTTAMTTTAGTTTAGTATGGTGTEEFP
ncbi:BTAD domain-containing putative transcriptional regulator [Frankia alni]|uniref:LuxR-family transcriptional regulator n=1 Tax=Frankia alni (strain DSM 45986 / CECT 9034 / ACN14a) TaxID=326424 RepID=Q0RLE9_FRAAA|nr:BTAD domain-containing putative transcriptional regulator [Frankia alni]CAJ61655.1 Putative LuxR-family transcriptional regulator [Frankia alni ACN14a]